MRPEYLPTASPPGPQGDGESISLPSHSPANLFSFACSSVGLGIPFIGSSFACEDDERTASRKEPKAQAVGADRVPRSSRLGGAGPQRPSALEALRGPL